MGKVYVGQLLPHVAELHRRAEEAFARELMQSFERMESDGDMI